MKSLHEINHRDIPDTLVLSLDFDGCTDKPEARQKLIEFIIDYCSTRPHYKFVALAIGSLRQSVLTDYYNAVTHYKTHGNQLVSCSLLLNEFAQELAVCLQKSLNTRSPKVQRINLLTSDLLNDLEIGTTLKQMDPSAYARMLTVEYHRPIPISIQDTSGNEVSEFTQEQFQAWYNQLTCEYDEAGVKHFLQSWSVELEQFEDYKQWRDTWQPAQITAQNKFGQQISLFTTALNEPSHPGNSIQFDDTSKILVLYMLHQFVANKIKKAFDTLHLDDRTDLLDPIDLFYQTHPTLLPLNSAYQSVAWNSDEDFDASQIKMGPAIFGKGSVNSMYEHDVKEVAQAFRLNSCPLPIEVANKLIAQCTKQKSPSPEKSSASIPDVAKLSCPKPISSHQGSSIFGSEKQTHEPKLNSETQNTLLPLYRPKPVRARPNLNIFDLAQQTQDIKLNGETVKDKGTASGFVT